MTPIVPGAFLPGTACSDSVFKEYRREIVFDRLMCCDEEGSYLRKVSGFASFRELVAR
jgi:hypothetical protein